MTNVGVPDVLPDEDLRFAQHADRVHLVVRPPRTSPPYTSLCGQRFPVPRRTGLTLTRPPVALCIACSRAYNHHAQATAR